MLILLGLVLTSVLLHVHAQVDQSGFISIDCGIVKGESYTDDITNINYVSDANFIDSGEMQKILPEYYVSTNIDTQFMTLTSFPNNTRNCYTLKPINGKGNRYLIRARFMHGNYDSERKLPEFDVYLGPDYWSTIRVSSPSESINREIIHVLSSDYLHVCLLNTGSGTPFISVIELRLLKSDMYTQTGFGSLSLFGRFGFGNASETVRYKDDKYDRLWSPVTNWSNTTSLYTSDKVFTQNIFDPPSNVMSHAITPINSNITLTIDLNPGDATGDLLYYMHLNEIEILEENQKREFNIYINGFIVAGPYSPIFHTTLTVYSLKPQPSAPMYKFAINKTPDSTLLPIINAAEFYSIIDLPQRQTYDKDAAAMWSIKSAYRLTKNWQGDPCAPQKFVWDGIRCNYDDPESPRIVMLNLSINGLTGGIDPGLANLTMMQTVDLSNNNLTGIVPGFLSELKFLTELNLTGNNFTGPIPSVLLAKAKKGSLLLSFDGESTSASTSSCNGDACKNKKDNKLIVPLIAGVSIIIIIILIVLAFMWKKIIKKKKKRGTRLETRKKQYTYLDIHNITNKFNVVLGKGTFGTVYLGIIDDKQVAVKMFSGTSTQMDKEFKAEVYLLLSVHHKNLTSLVGYCDDESHKGIIYEYMANGNLERRLSDRTSSVLNWEERLQIGGDVAQGLEYMHHGCKPAIVHRDVKCANILLNEAFQAKLGDFGLSRAFPKDGSYISTNVAGTPGYLDPEYITTHKLTEKSDVYSFGVVLLVLITGQPAVITTEDNEKLHISRIVNSKLESGDMSNIVDPSLRGGFDVNSAWKAVELAMACVAGTPNTRPTMKKVVIELNDCLVSERARKEAIPNPNITGSVSLDLEIAHDPTAV